MDSRCSRIFACALSLLFVNACTEGHDTESTVIRQEGESVLVVPDFSSRNIPEDSLRLEVERDEEDTALLLRRDDDGLYRGQIEGLQPNSTVQLGFLLYSDAALLASLERRVVLGSSGRTVRIEADDGWDLSHDQDGDGASNLDELNAGTDWRDPGMFPISGDSGLPQLYGNAQFTFTLGSSALSVERFASFEEAGMGVNRSGTTFIRHIDEQSRHDNLCFVAGTSGLALSLDDADFTCRHFRFTIDDSGERDSRSLRISQVALTSSSTGEGVGNLCLRGEDESVQEMVNRCSREFAESAPYDVRLTITR